MLVTMMMMALAAPNPSSLAAPRKAYAVCLKEFETESLAAKMNPAAYTTALKSACPAEAGALAKALTDYDIAMGSKRAAAAATAESDIADYRLTSEERFRDMSPSAPQAATASSAAPSTTAPPATVPAAQKVDASAPK